MTTPKHTPAPWIAYKRKDTMFDIQTESYFDEYNEEVSDVICESVCLPNAKLIAAAPELFEALEKLADFFSDIADFSNPYAHDTINKARAAIARATQ